ncbi:MAG: hypothetical protein K0S41_4356 [Anaerocolumna sp.]|jgi:hypothetical protein|nr:hypothetical protein [Anaerocolumna sp.]
MLNKNLKKFCLLMSLGFVLTATACDKKDDKSIKNNTTNEITQNNNQEDGEKQGVLNQESTDVNNALVDDTTSTESSTDSTVSSNSIDSSEKKDNETVERVATKEISIYTLNEETEEVEAVTALIPADTEITPELIVEYVADSLADRLIEVGLDPVTTKGDTVIVSFKSDQPPLINVGAGLESTILDAFAQSLVDNLDNYKKVIFRKEGQAYSSGHLQYGIDEVYLDGTKTN